MYDVVGCIYVGHGEVKLMPQIALAYLVVSRSRVARGGPYVVAHGLAHGRDLPTQLQQQVIMARVWPWKGRKRSSLKDEAHPTSDTKPPPIPLNLSLSLLCSSSARAKYRAVAG